MTHKEVSFIKSSIRLCGLVFLGFGLLVDAAVVLGIAELLGIVEELV